MGVPHMTRTIPPYLSSAVCSPAPRHRFPSSGPRGGNCEDPSDTVFEKFDLAVALMGRGEAERRAAVETLEALVRDARPRDVRGPRRCIGPGFAFSQRSF